jgi:hypothetical protein
MAAVAVAVQRPTDAAELAHALGRPLAGVIPADPGAVRRGLQAGRPPTSGRLGRAGGNDLVGELPAGTEHRVLRGDASLVAGAGHQHADAVHVAGGEHVRQAAAQIPADLDVPAGGGDAHSVGAELLGVAGPADGEEHRRDLELGLLAAGAILHGDASWGAVEPFDQRCGQHADTAAAEGIGQRGGDVLVRVRDKAGRRLDEGDLGAEVGQDRGELAAGIGATDHRHRRGQRGEAANVLIGQRELGTRDRQPTGMPADRDDDGVPAEGAPVGGSHRVRVDEPGRSCVLDQVDPLATDDFGQSPLLVRVAGDPVGVGERGGDVDLRDIAPHAKLPPGLGVTQQASGAGQGADRCRPLVQAGPAHSLGLDQRHVGAKLTGLQRRAGPGGSTTEHEHSHRPTMRRWVPMDITRHG